MNKQWPLWIILLLSSGCEPGNQRAREIHGYVARGEVEKVRGWIRRNPRLIDAIQEPFIGHTPLHTAASTGQAEAALILLENGANVSAKDNGSLGKQPIHLAVEEGHKNVLEVLLKYKANINSKTKIGMNPVDCAAWNGRKEVLELLLERGAEINLIGGTPLHGAAGGGHLEVCKTLLAYKVDVNAKTREGNTALFFAAVSGGHKEVAGFLLSKGAKKDLGSATALGDCDFVRQRLQEDKKLIHTKLDLGPPTLLHLASKRGHAEMVTLLLDYKANPNLSHFGITPLHHAAESGHTNVVKTLLARGAKVNIQDNEGITPLHLGAKENKAPAVEVLLQHKANVNATDNDLETPLHFAVSYEAGPKVLNLLLVHGADPNAKDSAGTTPMMLGRYNRNSKQILPLLRKFGGKE